MEGGAAREEGSALRKPTFSPIVRLVGRSVGRARPATGRLAGAVLASRFPEYYNLNIEGRRERGEAKSDSDVRLPSGRAG